MLYEGTDVLSQVDRSRTLPQKKCYDDREYQHDTVQNRCCQSIAATVANILRCSFCVRSTSIIDIVRNEKRQKWSSTEKTIHAWSGVHDCSNCFYSSLPTSERSRLVHCFSFLSLAFLFSCRVIQIHKEKNDDGREIFAYMQTFDQDDFLLPAHVQSCRM